MQRIIKIRNKIMADKEKQNKKILPGIEKW